MYKRMAATFAEFFVALIIILFFSAFGMSSSFAKAIHDGYFLIVHTLAGKQLFENYSGVSWGVLLASFWLMVLATLLSVLLGSFYALFSFRLKSRVAGGINEIVAGVLQSLPEAMYVVVIFVVLVYLLKHGINLPGLFHDGVPRFQDAFAPAIALALPGIFYLRRVLTLRFQDESSAQYVATAEAKGLSDTRIFYTHILPNVMSTIYRQLPVVAGFVISSALFAEFFLGYMALLFRLPMFAGWDMLAGSLGLHKPAGVPIYQPGAIFVVGILLVATWLIFSLFSELLQASLPQGIETVPTPTRRKTDVGWILAGVVLIIPVLSFSLFPHLLTAQSPTAEHLMNTQTTAFPPYPPSQQYPMGTDMEGRDLLSQTLHGTFSTLLEVVVTTCMVLAGSVALATWLSVGRHPFISGLTTRVGRVLSAMPTLFVVFLAMYDRNMNSPLQGLQYVLWIAVFEIGRGAIAFYGGMSEWFRFGFVEGAESIGQTKLSILYRQLKSWFGQFTLEFAFTEFTRVLSLMTLLAMFHTYPVEKIIYTDNGPSIGPAQITWFSILGDAANQAMSIITFPFLIYAPVVFLLATMMGASFIARGFRGTR